MSGLIETMFVLVATMVVATGVFTLLIGAFTICLWLTKTAGFPGWIIPAVRPLWKKIAAKLRRTRERVR